MGTYRAHGKLLISGEYLITKGAKGLALPLTKMFQSLVTEPRHDQIVHWKSLDDRGLTWIEAEYELPGFKIKSASQDEIALRTKDILSFIQSKVPGIFGAGLTLKTNMNFSPSWGLGSSSTLMSLLGDFSGIDPFELQQHFFQGSGYDIACAREKSPLIYSLRDKLPQVEPVKWNPPFRDNLVFIYLGNKKNSREAMKAFEVSGHKIQHDQIQEIDRLTEAMVSCSTLGIFIELIKKHEEVISRYLNLKPVKDALFPDFDGALKSLGGWGGDFIMAASQNEASSVMNYFRSRGLDLCLRWDDLIE